MNRENAHNDWWMIVSVFIALLLTIMPLPTWAVWARPQWVFAILLFWVITMPQRYGVGLAWLVGLLMDFLTGTAVGQHAFIFALLIYVALKLHVLIRHLPMWQQMGVIGLFSILNLLLARVILDIMGNGVHGAAFWPPALTTVVIWPWIFVLLGMRQSRHMIH